MIKDLTPEEILNLSFITDDEVLPISEIVKNKTTKNTDRFKSNFEVIDKAIDGGFKAGDLVIISGISGEGKTLYAQTLTYNFSNAGISCLWFSYEVSLEFLDRKFQAMGLQDNYLAYAPKKNTTGKLDWLKYKIKESWIKYATKIVFIDMIDFLSPVNIQSRDNETITLKKIAQELKTLAIELDIVIITMAHITKLREGEEAGMQNIAWSSGIYQVADYVFMISREKIKQKKQFREVESGGEDLCTNNSFIKIVKNRETGQLKKIKCQYVDGKLIQLTNQYENDNKNTKRFDYFQN